MSIAIAGVERWNHRLVLPYHLHVAVVVVVVVVVVVELMADVAADTIVENNDSVPIVHCSSVHYHRLPKIDGRVGLIFEWHFLCQQFLA